MATFQVVTDAAGEYRWRLRANNNKIIADSSEGCEHGIALVKKLAPDAEVEDQA